MAVPDYQKLMLPLLKRAAAATTPTSVPELRPLIAADMALTEDQLAERLPSGTETTFSNRVYWARVYLTRAGLLETTKRGRFVVTAAGKALLATAPIAITNGMLDQYPAFLAWRQGSTKKPTLAPTGSPAPASEPPSPGTPEERIEAARIEIDAGLRADLLDRVRQMNPSDFEALIVLLLVRMGYGQGREELARAIGGSGDGGVDGVVHQDLLGLDRVYVQAKRYKAGSNVGPDAVNSFIGALNIKKASKGLFVTASAFTKQAMEHVSLSSTHVVLVDGERLTELMVRHNVGVTVQSTVEIKAINETFFDN